MSNIPTTRDSAARSRAPRTSARGSVKADSRYLADAHVVAAAVETGGGVVLTGDPDDLVSLAAPYPNISVQPLP